MSRIPIVNPNRFYDNKEIDLVSLLPNSMKDTEIQTFLSIFEKYLNEMYEGATKYIPPENLESIPYTNQIIWTDKYQYLTAPYGDLLNHFKAGDFIKRNNESKYYKIEEVIDNSTIKLVEPYVNETPSYLKSAFWDEFGESDFVPFWTWSLSGVAPEGMDSSVPQIYKLDNTENRIYCIDPTISATSGTTSSTIANKLYGDLEFEFSFQRNQDPAYRNRKFGFRIESGNDDSLFYDCYYENGFLKFIAFDMYDTVYVSAYIEANDSEDGWVVNFTKVQDTGKIKVKVSSLKKKSGTIPVGFTSGVGFFNRFNYEIDVSAVGDVYDKFVTLKLINGYQQAWNYMYLQADMGFPGEADTQDLISNFTELPENQYIYGTPFGRVFENDGNNVDIYQFYHSGGKLRIRDLATAFSFSATDFRSSINHISILEKIHRLTELHDPDLIDIEYIQFFSKYLGYDVDINRETMGIFLANGDENWDEMNDEEKQDLQDKYLRFVITSLPTWYKIKTTENAISTMLYSFGLVTELSHYFCTNYGDNGTWVNESVTSGITNKHYQTPHFSVLINTDTSISDFSSNPERMAAIIDAINSVKPINTVFRGLVGYFKRNMDIFVSAIAYYNQYMYLN